MHRVILWGVGGVQRPCERLIPTSPGLEVLSVVSELLVSLTLPSYLALLFQSRK